MYFMIVEADTDHTRSKLESLIESNTSILSARWNESEAHICVECKDIADSLIGQIKAITNLNNDAIFAVPAMNM